MDVSARVLLESWPLPTVTAVSSITLGHESLAEFLIDTSGETRAFTLSSQPIRTACLALDGVIGTSLNCGSIKYFERRIAAPFSEITSTYQDLTTITVGTFQNAAMFGTSLRGTWTVDISDILYQLRTYQAANPGYNGCTLAEPCTAEESFWRHFRGIELKVFWVSTS
jgi:hypothetical protein